MSYIPLSNQAKQICESHYDLHNKKNPGCGKCPIRIACVTNTTVHTKDQLNSYTENINKMAASVIPMEATTCNTN